jgi:RNA polymerase sigma-B factor
VTVEPRDAERARLFEELRDTGSPAVRERLVESYLPLARFFARRYSGRGGRDDDLDQVAAMALVKAVDRFDPDLGVAFSTFAGRTIDGELKRYFRDTSWAVRVPRRAQEQALLVRRTVDELSTELGRSPTVPEVAVRSGLDEDEVLEALDASTARRADSLDRPVGDSDGSMDLGSSFGEVDRRFHQADVREAVVRLLETLPDRERRIVELRFYGELSQSAIAEQIGISQMHVSRLLRRTLEQLREQLA